jgi:CHASE2 domain-containing sensor protein
MRPEREPFVPHLLYEMPLLVFMIVVGVGLQEYGFYGPIERFVVDAFAATESRRPANDTFILDIDDETYAEAFNRTSPLDKARLAELIQAAIAGGARAVAVDVDTDPADVLALDVLALVKERRNTRIVWARAPRLCGETGCVLLANESLPAGNEIGVALLQVDTDNTVRRYRPLFEIAEARAPDGCACTGRLVPSFPRAAILAGRIDGAPLTERPLLLNWNGDRFSVPRMSAGQALKDWKTDWWGKSQPISGRIVLIGGTFEEARDVRSTPAGPMAGVEIMAQIIETEKRGGGLAEFSIIGASVLDLLLSVALVWVNWRYPAETRTGLALNAVIVLALPFAAAWLLHRYALYWVNVAPVLCGVWISQWHERAKELARAGRF